jgi:predicted AlkP superfamily pyrophosphatase or phosphodiesterase
MKARSRFLIALFIASSPGAASAAPAQRPADHVFVVMLDGCRPDLLRRARTPNLRALGAAGTTYLQARTIYPSQTRVAFVSLPTGAYPGSHGVVGGNDVKDAEWKTVAMGDDDPIAAQALVARPTVFEAATAAGLTSLYAAMKGYELVGARGATWTINGKKTLDPAAWKTRYEPLAEGSADLAAGYKQLLSRQLLDQTLQIVREKRPSLVVVNLGAADYAAHSFGPESLRYLLTLEYLDGLVGDLLKALDELGIRQRTAVIVSADHGFSDVDATRLVAPAADAGGHRLDFLAARGIEHYVTNTGGSSMGVYIRDKGRVAEAVKDDARGTLVRGGLLPGRHGRVRPHAGIAARVFPGSLAGPDGGPGRRRRAQLPAAGAARQPAPRRHVHPADPVRGRGRVREDRRRGPPGGHRADGDAAARAAPGRIAAGRPRARRGLQP